MKKHDAMTLMVFGKPKSKEEGSPMADEEEAEEHDAGERAAFDGFAEAAGIPEERRDDAYRELRSMIRQCLMAEKEGEYGEPGHDEEE